jgi:hypothetical protein
MGDGWRAERLKEFYRRLEALPPFRSAEEAMLKLAETLTAVEDELTSIPNHPENWRSDGRMYPPQEDYRFETSHSDVVEYRSRKHSTYVRTNGAIEIRKAVGKTVEFEKPGADGRKVWE